MKQISGQVFPRRICGLDKRDLLLPSEMLQALFAIDRFVDVPEPFEVDQTGDPVSRCKGVGFALTVLKDPQDQVIDNSDIRVRERLARM